LISGIDCAIAGAASVAAPAAPSPVTLMKSLLFMISCPDVSVIVGLLAEAWNQHDASRDRMPSRSHCGKEKARPPVEAGLSGFDLRLTWPGDQPRVRERIMKLS
jgi:hypothetical protein